jgi:hypothetical protein
MTTLKDGRFVFIHAERHHLLIEQQVGNGNGGAATKNTAVSSPLPTQLLYGGTVYAFALNAAQTRIALACPTASAAVSTVQDPEHHSVSHSVLRLFSFTNNEVGELLGEFMTAVPQRIIWVSERYIALNVITLHDEGSRGAVIAAPRVTNGRAGQAFSSIILLEVTKSPVKIKLVREDKTSAAPAAGPGSVLCDLCPGKQTLRLWDLQRSKMTGECPLPNRKCRHGKARTATTTASEGPFVLVANDDWTVHVFYVGKGGAVHTPKPMLTQFESQSTRRVTQESAAPDIGADGQGQGEQGEMGEAGVKIHDDAANTDQPSHLSSVAHSSALPAPQLHVRLLSDTQVLVALTGSPVVLQCVYDPKTKAEELTVVAKMRLPRRLWATAEVVALSRTKCLVRERVVTEGEATEEAGQSTSTYIALPLELKATGKGTVETPVAAERAGDKCGTAVIDIVSSGGAEMQSAAAAAAGEKKRKKKKRKTTAAADVAVEENVPKLPGAPSGAATGTTSSSSSPAGGRSRAGGATQRAVERLLVYVGISGKDQLPNAFAKDDGKGSRTPAAAVTVAAKADGTNPPLRKEGWLSTDALVTMGGVVVGLVVGVCVMRRLSLL